jgi:hypothetical protein
MTTEQVTKDEQDFEAAFAEQAGRQAQASDAQPNKDEPKPGDKPEPEAPAEDPLKQSDAAKEPAGTAKRPADDAGKSDIERQLAEALHKERSSANRLSHFMRENNRLTQLVQTLERENADLKAKVADSPSSAKKDVLAEAPELEAAVRSRVEAALAPLRAKLEAANARLAEVDGGRDFAEAPAAQQPGRDDALQVASTQQQLDAAFPSWRTDTQSVEFARWLNAQPLSIQNAYEHAVGFNDCATVMRLFYAAKGAPKQQTADPPAVQQQPSSQDRLRHAAGIAPKGGNAPVPPAESKKDDFERSFEEFALQAAQRRTKR